MEEVQQGRQPLLQEVRHRNIGSFNDSDGAGGTLGRVLSSAYDEDGVSQVLDDAVQVLAEFTEQVHRNDGMNRPQAA